MRRRPRAAAFLPEDARVKPAGRRSRRTGKGRGTRAERRAARNVVLSVHKRPVVCPPDRTGRSPLFRLFGLACRALVIWAASTGLSAFISDAFRFGAPGAAVPVTALVTVVLCMGLLSGPIPRYASLAAAGGTAAALFAARPTLLPDIWNGLLSLCNAALDRLGRAGYVAYLSRKIPVSSETPQEELTAIGVCALTFAVSALFALCLGRKARIAAPAAVSCLFLVAILTFNLYSNRIRSNLGIALLVTSLASAPVMAACDRLYRAPDPRRFDTGLRLFEGDGRPEPPAPLEAPATAPRSRAEREEARKARRDFRRRARAARRYDRATLESRSAMGGYAGAAALALCFLAVALPAVLVRGNFSVIPAIDEKVAYAREYVTAVLQGDAHALDRLDYRKRAENFRPHSVELRETPYDGRQILYLQTRYRTNYYLRGWIGADYEEGAWTAPDDATQQRYHEDFGVEACPAEEMRYRFYRYMKPELVDDPEYTARYDEKYRSAKPYGFVSLLVSMRRVNSPSSLCYFPVSFDPRALYGFRSMDGSDLSYVNYFDGLYTGRDFARNGASYAAVAYAPVMTDPDWIRNQAELQALYMLERETLLAQTGYSVGKDGRTTSRLQLLTEEREDGRTMFVYALRPGRKDEVRWRCFHRTEDVRRDGHSLIARVPGGEMTLTLDGRMIVGAALEIPSGRGIGERGAEDAALLTEEEKRELLAWAETDGLYESFVYDSYTQPSGLGYIKERAERYLPRRGRPAAALRGSADAEVYIARDRLVRDVIDRLITEEGCVWTRTPDLTKADPSLDGVGNFLLRVREGDSAQFASAAALILRECGIPVRYVEGYIAHDLHYVNRGDFEYGGYVRGADAHAWIEVYYDGVGWIPYETTPVYYADLYGKAETDPVIPFLPTAPEVPGPVPVVPPRPPRVDPTETPPTGEETEEETLSQEDAVAAATTRYGLAALAALAVLVALAVWVRHVVTGAREAEERRQDTARRILSPGFGAHTNERDRREMARLLTDACSLLLDVCGLAPKTGEFRAEYAERLAGELTAPEAPGREGTPLPDIRLALDAAAAEEFGHGMSLEGMRAVASLYLFLHGEAKRRIPRARRIALRYARRRI